MSIKREFNPKEYEQYASLKDPTFLEDRVYFEHTERTITFHEKYPKAMYHLILIPRVAAAPIVPHNLYDLRTFLNAPEVTKSEAQDFLTVMKEDAEKIKRMIEEDMMHRMGFKWGIWMGFKPQPSYRYLHLHIISSDLLEDRMKSKEHYNSFHPKLGYFLHLDDVLEWFELIDYVYDEHKLLPQTKYNALLKNELECFYKDCCVHTNSISVMKEHLKEEFDKIQKREEAAIERRRKYYEMTERIRKNRERKLEEARIAKEAEGSAGGNNSG